MSLEMSDSTVCGQCPLENKCCENMMMYNVCDQDLEAVIGDGASVEVDTEDELSMVFAEREYKRRGIYFLRTGDVNRIAMIGTCPNLENGECTIYENRPSPCRNFEASGEVCRAIRN